jgi:hypothetical protein
MRAKGRHISFAIAVKSSQRNCRVCCKRALYIGLRRGQDLESAFLETGWGSHYIAFILTDSVLS